ncbi:MAG: hypothetical protein V2I47_04160, partial [Bacteroidales bacterium]|nr:hypothetical protein [Bacteroidales bacterium]
KSVIFNAFTHITVPTQKACMAGCKKKSENVLRKECYKTEILADRQALIDGACPEPCRGATPR